MSLQEAIRAVQELEPEDDYGLDCEDDGKVFLDSVTFGRKNIGKLVEVNGIIVYAKDVNLKLHLFRKSNSWGVNGRLANVLARFDGIIVYRTEHFIYSIDAKKVIMQKEAHYRDKGYERQRLVPLYLWNKESKRAYGKII